MTNAETLAALDAAAIYALTNHQRQLDLEGIYVGVSRQALDEVLTYLRSPTILATFARVEKLEAENARLREALTYIRDGGGMLSQPAALNCPELEWANKRIWHLETLASAALQETSDEA